MQLDQNWTLSKKLPYPIQQIFSVADLKAFLIHGHFHFFELVILSIYLFRQNLNLEL